MQKQFLNTFKKELTRKQLQVTIGGTGGATPSPASKKAGNDNRYQEES